MYNGYFSIPRRMAKKEGIFGVIKTSDAIMEALIVISSIALMMMLKNILVMFLGLFASVGGYLFFVMYDKFGENARIKTKRMLEHQKRQHLYYYYRGTR